MHPQDIAPRRWIVLHRRELALGTALVVTLALLLLAGPWLLALAAVEWKSGGRKKRLLGLMIAALLLRAARWLWRDLHGLPHGRWHPCLQCGAPIEAPSRAWYCSPACRRYARLDHDAAGGDERAQARLARLRLPQYDPELTEVPF